MANILHVQDGDWQSIESGAKPALVDFWAEWCGPCRMLAPTFEKLAEKYAEQITFAKVDVDALGDLANRFGVRSIPTLLLVRRGEVVERIVGVQSLENLSRLLDRYVATPEKK